MNFVQTTSGDFWNLDKIIFINRSSDGWYKVVFDNGHEADVNPENIDDLLEFAGVQRKP